MPINKPYFRIIRPKISRNNIIVNQTENNYITDIRYARNRSTSIRAMHILIEDLKRIFEFIEPSDSISNSNKHVFSHRIFELFLRASTEFESNCNHILKANGYEKPGNWTMKDYFLLNKALKLSEYKLKIPMWYPEPLIIMPFKDWGGRESYAPLLWYQDYNKVKHNRYEKFELANLENLLNAIAATFSILYAQFNLLVFHPSQYTIVHDLDEENYHYSGDSYFRVKNCFQWDQEEKYDFNWDELKDEENPFQQFNFNVQGV